MAKYGVMILHNGTWNGKRIVSEDWLGEATHTCFPLSGGLFKVFRDLGQRGLGYSWWVFPNMVAAEGHAGQHVYVVRDKNAVVVFTAEGRFALPAELYRDYIRDAL
jgi:CubicO group peptidase (beta-lactamase class C family)